MIGTTETTKLTRVITAKRNAGQIIKKRVSAKNSWGNEGGAHTTFDWVGEIIEIALAKVNPLI
jgi:hypothetical protein